MKAALFFLGLFALSAAQVSVTQTVTAGTASTFTLSGSGSFASALTNLLPSLSISSNATSSITLSLSIANPLSAILSGSSTVNFAGGLAIKSDGSSTSANANIFAGASFESTLGSALAGITNLVFTGVQLQITAASPVQLTITGTTGSFAASGNANLQVGLFTSYSDNVLGSSSSASSSTTVSGTVPYSIAADGKTYTYTIIVPTTTVSGQSATAFSGFFKPFDSSKAKSSNNGGTAASSGSSSFSSNLGFIPGVFGYDFALTGGQQYAFGNNLQVTPSASSGSQGTININNAGIFSSASASGSSNSGNSAAPSQVASTGAFFNSYYQISGSGQTNVLQWSSTPSDSTWTANAFTSVNTTGAVTTSSSTTGAALAASAQAKGQAYSWYKSSTSAGASAAASTWTRVSSTSSADASAGIKVYANVNSYSQWTVASGNGNAVKATFVTLIVALLVIMF